MEFLDQKNLPNLDCNLQLNMINFFKMRIFLLIFILFFTIPVLAVSEEELSELVERAPKIESKNDLKKLVNYLTSTLKDDEEKAFVLLIWIVKNIDYDDYKYKIHQIEKKQTEKDKHKKSDEKIPKTDIVKTRLGVCADISKLYTDMLKIAEIKSHTVAGCVSEIDKNGKCKNDDRHQWNVVWIKNQWEFVDPTWAIKGERNRVLGNLSEGREYKKEIKRREKSKETHTIRENRFIDKKWFMVAPETMQENHHPDSNKWLLLNDKDRKNKKL